MSRVITFDKGSKRRLQRIRWNAAEKTTLVLLFLLLAGLGVTLALWTASRATFHLHDHRLKLSAW